MNAKAKGIGDWGKLPRPRVSDYGLTHGLFNGGQGVEASDLSSVAAHVSRSPETQALDALPAQINRQGNAHQTNKQVAFGEQPLFAPLQQAAGRLGEQEQGVGSNPVALSQPPFY